MITISNMFISVFLFIYVSHLKTFFSSLFAFLTLYQLPTYFSVYRISFVLPFSSRTYLSRSIFLLQIFSSLHVCFSYCLPLFKLKYLLTFSMSDKPFKLLFYEIKLYSFVSNIFIAFFLCKYLFLYFILLKPSIDNNLD